MKGLRPNNEWFTIWSNTRSVFTLWPEWRDYDTLGFIFETIFRQEFLPCDLNEGITTYILKRSIGIFFKNVFTLWPEWRDYDQAPIWESCPNMVTCFYLVTWMKGLRPARPFYQICNGLPMFLPCDLNEGITTHWGQRAFRPQYRVFTLWPEWRDYDNCSNYGDAVNIPEFLPCDLNEGITTCAGSSGLPHFLYRVFTLWPEWRDYDDRVPTSRQGRLFGFYLVTWMKGLRLA